MFNFEEIINRLKNNSENTYSESEEEITPKTIIQNKVKENGIVDIIFNMKEDMEISDIKNNIDFIEIKKLSDEISQLIQHTFNEYEDEDDDYFIEPTEDMKLAIKKIRVFIPKCNEYINKYNLKFFDEYDGELEYDEYSNRTKLFVELLTVLKIKMNNEKYYNFNGLNFSADFSSHFEYLYHIAYPNEEEDIFHMDYYDSDDRYYYGCIDGKY
jgi:hypothetical protein